MTIEELAGAAVEGAAAKQENARLRERVKALEADRDRWMALAMGGNEIAEQRNRQLITLASEVGADRARELLLPSGPADV